MDGCSSGRESHFVSSLYVKSLQKTCLTLPQLEDPGDGGLQLSDFEGSALGRIILEHLFEDVKAMAKLLSLDKAELLSTVILLVHNSEKEECYINFSGDGFYAVNNELIEIDQQNMPDFMGYHLKEEFDSWFDNHTLPKQFSKVKSVCISTDGISKFLDKKKGRNEDPETIFQSLTQHPPNKTLEDNFRTLLQDTQLVPYDDVALIRLQSP